MSSTRLTRALAALVLVLGLAGCTSSSQSAAPTTAPSSSAATSAPASGAATSGIASADASTGPKTDAEGGAIGTPVKPSGSSLGKKQIGNIPRPSDADAQAALITVLRKNEDAEIRRIKLLGMTQDHTGMWWALFSFNDAMLGDTQAVIMYNGRIWDEAVYGVDVKTSDLPADVKF